MKIKSLISLLALSSCSLFSETPEKVIQGQRIAYQSATVIKDNIKNIVTKYVVDISALITYHYNYTYELDIDKIRKDSSISNEEEKLRINTLEKERDEKIKIDIDNVKKESEEILKSSDKDIDILLKLLESVYNYMSTTPIKVDNIEFYIDLFKNRLNSNGTTD